MCGCTLLHQYGSADVNEDCQMMVSFTRTETTRSICDCGAVFLLVKWGSNNLINILHKSNYFCNLFLSPVSLQLALSGWN